MVELQDITGVGASRADDLEEMGYTSVEDVADANPDDLTELSRVGEDRAIEMVVDAQNLADSEESEEEEETVEEEPATITFDEEEPSIDEEEPPVEEEEPPVEEEEPAADEDSEEAAEATLFEVDADFGALERDVSVYALLDSYTSLQSRNVSRSNACMRVLEKIRDSTSVMLTEEELNAFHAAIRQQRLEYQGNNHVEMMRVATRVEDSVSTVREEELF
jgi:hypothetical protein